MRYLLILTLFLIGCDQNLGNLEGTVVTSENLRQFSDQCEKLTKCVGATFEIVHFSNQKNNPYACLIQKKGKTRTKNVYLYPKAEISFGKLRFDNFENAIAVCELITETGSKSDKYYAELETWYAALKKERRYKKRQQEELEKETARLNSPVKVREE